MHSIGCPKRGPLRAKFFTAVAGDWWEDGVRESGANPVGEIKKTEESGK